MRAADRPRTLDSAAPGAAQPRFADVEREAERSGARGPKIVEVLIPAYNEERNIGVVLERVFASLGDPRYRIEALVVDDGSQDRTADVVRAYGDRHPVTLLSLSRNFGKETALLAGLDHARGDATIIMDADLQHPVELIPRFLEEWEAGYKCVYAVRENRGAERLAKALLVKLFYWLVNYGSKFRIEPNAVDFRLLDRAAVEALRSLRERVRFTKGLYAWVGFKSKGIPFVPNERYAGKSKFGSRSLLRLGWDGLTSFSDLPLRLSSIVGCLVSLGSLVYGGWIAIRTLAFGVEEPGWATLVVAVTFLSGVQMLFLGILGQYIRNIFLETKDRPSYVLAEVARSPLCAAKPGEERSPAPESAAQGMLAHRARAH
ncbi:MAG TPA: glycosyltransferase family 2 protein [Gammaproteobacteria bacterium]|nr:glycosyltransferase family 2 protein [Gammaproteobacteria bacterium]